MSATAAYPMPLHAGIRAAREATGRTAKDVASEVGISPQYLSDIEQGKRLPPIELVERLGAALGIPTPNFAWLWVREQLGPELAGHLATWLRAGD